MSATSSTRSAPLALQPLSGLILLQVSARACSADISVRVSFLEIYNENIRDLLDHAPAASSKSISIRDDAAGNVKVLGASEISVHSCSDMVCRPRPALQPQPSTFSTEFGF